MTVLVLGGTSEARALAQLLHDEEVPFVSSLAGAVQRPRLPIGTVRVGGFGGVPGLLDHLRSSGVSAVVDATHPFAGQISGNAVHACRQAGVPLLRLERPGWEDHPLAPSWTWVDDHLAAAQVAARSTGTVLLTTGRRHLEQFVAPLAHHQVLVRVVDPVALELPTGWSVLQARGPYDLPAERELLQHKQIRTLVTKDSGGDLTAAKLRAAAELSVAVVVVRRPPTDETVHRVSAVRDAARWVRERQAQQPT